MSRLVTVVTYHYVRDTVSPQFPGLRYLPTRDFVKQLDALQKSHHFVRLRDCLEVITTGGELPENAALLTFDDGYMDHYLTVLPILNERGLSAVFFPTAHIASEEHVLDVHKIQFVLAAIGDERCLVSDLFSTLDRVRTDYSLPSNDYFLRRFLFPGRFDTGHTTLLKRLLQRELPQPLRTKIVGELFRRYVTLDEKGFAEALYMHAKEFLKLKEYGMAVGSHGFDHVWLDTLAADEQAREIALSRIFLERLGVDRSEWTMAYPYGAYNGSLLEILRREGCRMAFTTKVGIAELRKNNLFTLERFDTNDLRQASN